MNTLNALKERSKRNIEGGLFGRLGWLYVLVSAPILYVFRVVLTKKDGQYDWLDASALGLATGVLIVGAVLVLYERSRRG